MPAKKKKSVAANRSTPKRGAAQKGRKRKQDSESEEEVSEDESAEVDSEDSAVSVYSGKAVSKVIKIFLSL